MTQKLAQYDLTPETFVPSYIQFGQQESVNIPKPNPNELRFFRPNDELSNKEE